MNEEMVFDTLERIQINIKIQKENKQFVLMEALEGDINRYKDLQLSKAKIEEGEFAGMKELHTTEAIFLASCLFEKRNEHDGLQPVSLDTILGMPGRISKKLFKKLEQISGLSDDRTSEQIQREIKQLQKKLELLNKGKESEELEEGNPSKN